MKVSIERSALLKAMSQAQSVVERRNTIPILANVLIEAEGGEISFRATDLDIEVVYKVVGMVERAGATTVGAHTLHEIVRKLPDGAMVELTDDATANRLDVVAGRSSFSLATLPREDFPIMANSEYACNFSAQSETLRRLFDKSKFAISTEETRYYLNGVYMHSSDGENGRVLRCVATDGHRLARIDTQLPEGADTLPGVIVPRKTVGELRKLLDDDEIDLIIEKINLHTIDENIDKQFHCSEILKQVSFFPSHKKYLTKYTLAICLRLTETFNYLGNFMFVRAGSKNTKIVKKDYSEMVLDVLEKSSIPLSSQEIKKIISNDRHVPSSPQIHKKGRLIPIRNFPENNKTSTWGLIDVHLKISKQQLEKIICAMESLIKRYDYKLTPEEGIKAIKGNTVLEEFQDKILVLFVLVDKNINFIEKNNTLFHVNGKIDNLSQEDCLKITASKISEDGMKKQDIFEKTQSLYGNDVAYNILSKLTQYGFTFNKNSETWHKGELVEY